MNILILVAQYSLSGVPLAQARLAAALVRRGHSVTYIIGTSKNNTVISPIDGVNIRVLNKNSARSMLWSLVKIFRSINPEIIFTAEDHLNIFVFIAALLSGSKSKISASSRVGALDRQAYWGGVFSKGWFMSLLMRAFMWRANALTCVSKDMVPLYHEILKTNKHTPVYNIVVDKSRLEMSRLKVDHDWYVDKKYPVIVSAGRFDLEKGFSDLIVAFSIVLKNKVARLVLLGDGPERNSINKLINDLGISSSVYMPGQVNNPLAYFSKSDVFVLASYGEGMPNVLIEAMMCGCTPVSTDCPTGPSEVLQDGKYGYLVPMRDPVAMAAAIERALDNPIPKEKLDEAVIPFEENAVIDRHFKILGVTA